MRITWRTSWLLVTAPATLGAGVSGCRPAQSSPAGEYEVVHGWPALPDGFRMGQVAGLATNSRDEVLVFHRADQSWLREEGMIRRPTILRLDARTGTVLDSLGADLFRNPHGLAVDRDDNIWVTDNNLHQVFKLSPTGRVLLTLGEAGVRGTDAAHFDGVTDVAAAPDGSMYVTDGYGNARVLKFSPTGELLLQWGEPGRGPGQFDLPHGVTLDADGRVYVADRSNVRIQVFTADGTYLHEWKSEALGRPWGLEVAPDGYLYVVDGGDYWLTSQFRSARPDTLPRDRARIHKLDLAGTILTTWGAYGRSDGQMVWPHDITVTRDGAVFVGEVHLGMRVQKFVPSGQR